MYHNNIGNTPMMGNCNVHMERQVKKYPLNHLEHWPLILDDIHIMWRSRSHTAFDFLLRTFNHKWNSKNEEDFVALFNKSYGGHENRFWYIGSLIPGNNHF